MDTHDPQLLEQANSLYWESDASVNEIAEKMDLSKGALYAMIQPMDADTPCPECASRMEFSNRTARDKGVLTCPGCELEEDAELVTALGLDPVDAVPPPPRSAYQPSASPGAANTVSVRTLVASTLLGLAAGLALGQMGRKG